MSGWVSVCDKSLTEVVLALQTVDDDGILTIDEKIRIVIPESSRLESIYQGIAAQAAALGVGIPDATAARTAWLALRDSLVPAWNDTTQPTPITRADWDGVLDTYRDALSSTQAALAAFGSVTVIPPAALAVSLDATGVPVGGTYPAELAPIVKRGAIDIRATDEMDYAITVTGDVAATVNDTDGDANKGKITVTAGTAGSIVLTVSVNGIALPAYTIAVTGEQQATGTVGNNASGARVWPDGWSETWRDVTFSGSDGATQKFAYGNGHVHGAIFKAWIEGDDGSSDVSVYVVPGGAEADGVTLRKSTASTVYATIFSKGDTAS